MRKIFKPLLFLIVLILSVLLIGLFVKGNKGNPIYYQTQMDTTVGGPYEASNSNSRYALTQAIVDSHTFFLNTSLAKFASPDVVEFKNKFISIFTPGVSLVAIPFYIIGKTVALPQLVTYFTTVIFALINLFLIAKIARKLGAGYSTSLLAGFIFLFATNALTYSQSLTQHHLSTTFILLGVLNAFEEKRTLINNLLFGIYLGSATLIDIPNPVIMLPLIAYILSKNFDIKRAAEKTKISVKLSLVGLLIGLIPFVGMFAYYNHATTGSYFTLAQNIGRTSAFSDSLPASLSTDVPDQAPASFGPLISIPFETRSEINGFYTLLISNERAWIYYSPVILLGILGILVLCKSEKYKKHAILLLSIISLNIVLYAMFGDPWGGWAFGPRYLIPSAALLCTLLAVAIEKYKKNFLFVFVFVATLTFSIGINTVGVLTTSAIPPKVEAVNLANPIPYTSKYNFQLIAKQTSSLLYNIDLSQKLTPYNYFVICTILVTIVALLLFLLSLLERKKNDNI